LHGFVTLSMSNGLGWRPNCAWLSSDSCAPFVAEGMAAVPLHVVPKVTLFIEE
jgi:hypothetical protein